MLDASDVVDCDSTELEAGTLVVSVVVLLVNLS